MPKAAALLKVLLIDDDELIRSAMVRILRRGGCDVTAIAACEEGLELTLKQRFSVILCDYHLPTGMQCSAFVPLLDDHHRKRVILISGTPHSDLDAEVLVSVAGRFLQKPFTLAAAMSTITDVVVHGR